MMVRMGTEGDNARVIAGRYRLEKRLGRGGMGVVGGRPTNSWAKQVAVKEIAQDNSLSEEARQQRDRTLREARAVAQLRHPHIIVVHDVVEQDERPYIVMELVDGGSLAERISARGPVDAAEAARIGIALLGALRTAHAAGVLHRDIKPANVLLQTATDEDGPERVVLTDFGIAQVAGATTLTESGAFVGSPEYTAPERMSGVRTGPESDLWSLGALLCTVLSGESPFRRDSLGGILHAVVVDEIRPPEQARPLLPVIRGLLERDPERRLEAAEAERMLRAFLDTGRTPKAAGASTGRHPRATSGHPGRPTPGYTPTQRNVPRRDLVPPRHPSPFARILYRRADLSAFHARVLVAALLVAALAGAGVSAVALLTRGNDSNGGAAPTSSAPLTSASAGTPSPSPKPSTPADTPTTPAASTGTPNTPTAPSGYRIAHDPDGFSLAVPEDFVRVPQGERIFYMSPGRPSGSASGCPTPTGRPARGDEERCGQRGVHEPRLPRRQGHRHHARRTPRRTLGVHLERLQHGGGTPAHLRHVLGGERPPVRRVGVRAGREGAGGEGVLRRRAGHLRPRVRPQARNGR